MSTPTPCLLPAMRARMGDWWYYVTTMTFQDIATRVKRVKDIQETSSLRTWIQRELRDERKREIAEYLQTQPQRLFNAIVLGLFGGAPDWYPISVSSGHVDTGADLEERTASAFGLVRLSGQEELFAIDGQHRVEGIKGALGREGGSKLAGEELAVILVAHRTDESGRQRTRRLFTTLNKYAKPVSPAELVALSEDDTFAVVTRRLVDEYPGLNSELVPLYRTANIPGSDKRSLTSLISLYSVVKALHVPPGRRAPKRLLKGPPEAETVTAVYARAVAFWDAVRATFPEVAAVCAADPQDELAGVHRHTQGGHFLFRPFCLVAFAKAVAVLVDRGAPVAETVQAFADVSVDLGGDPWRYVVWDPVRHTMINKEEPLVRNLLLHFADQPLAPESFDLQGAYKAAVGEAETAFHPWAAEH